MLAAVHLCEPSQRSARCTEIYADALKKSCLARLDLPPMRSVCPYVSFPTPSFSPCCHTSPSCSPRHPPYRCPPPQITAGERVNGQGGDGTRRGKQQMFKGGGGGVLRLRQKTSGHPSRAYLVTRGRRTSSQLAASSRMKNGRPSNNNTTNNCRRRQQLSQQQQQTQESTHLRKRPPTAAPRARGDKKHPARGIPPRPPDGAKLQSHPQ